MIALIAFMRKNQCLLYGGALFILFFFTANNLYSQTCTFTARNNGNWNSASTWTVVRNSGGTACSSFPNWSNTFQTVIIPNGITVNMNVNIPLNTTKGSITVRNGGSLIGANNTLTINKPTGNSNGCSATSTADFRVETGGYVEVGALTLQNSCTQISGNVFINKDETDNNPTGNFTVENNAKVYISGTIIVQGNWIMDNGSISATGTGFVDILGCLDATVGALNSVNVTFCTQQKTETGTCANQPAGVITTGDSDYNCGNTTLPISLAFFSVNYHQTAVQLDWVTLSESNNDFFSIEKSFDGKVFQEIAFVDGAGNSSLANYYSYTDEEAINGLVYYRLKQTDFDGLFSYSSVKALFINPSQETKTSIHPNPSSRYLNIVPASSRAIKKISVLNILGQEVYHGYIQGSRSNHLLDLSQLSLGQYTLQLYNEDGSIEWCRFNKIHD